MIVKAFKVIGISLVVIVLLMFGAGYYFVSSMCANTVVTSSTSPNGKWKVVLFERNCGATTGFSSQISLMKLDEELSNEAGNIYIAEGYPKGYTLNWKSDVSVKIDGASANSNKKVTQLNGIQFSYE
jgi:hypothetical protein